MFSFTAPVVRQGDGFHYNIISLPQPMADELKAQKVKRVIGQINGVAFRRALQSDGQGGLYLLFGKAMFKADFFRDGKVMAIAFEPDPDPDFVEIPEEFAELMAQDTALEAKFNTFTPGKQRSLMIYISTAKTVETRIKRSIELGRKIMDNQLYAQRKKERLD